MSYHRYPPLALNASISGLADKNVVDGVDGNSIEVTGPNVIPRSSSLTGLQIVANLADDISGIQVISDIGEFVEFYADLACTIFIATMVLTPDETVQVIRAAGSSVYIRAVKDVDIDQPGSYLAMNFLG